MDHSRDPCPWVALRDFDGAFCMGVSSIDCWQLATSCMVLELTTPRPSEGAVGHGVKGFWCLATAHIAY